MDRNNPRASQPGSAAPPRARRIHRALVVIALAFALGPGSAMAVHELRKSGPPSLMPVPLISQSHPWTCGGAALMATLVYFGVFDDAQSRLDAELGANAEAGTSVHQIVKVARRFGLQAEARTELTLDDVRRALAGGAVVIVAVQAWSSAQVKDWQANWEDGHYVVIVGLTDDRVYVMDPSVRTGYAYLPRGQFIERWHDYDIEGDRRIVWSRLGIIINGTPQIARYPAEPTRIE